MSALMKLSARIEGLLIPHPMGPLKIACGDCDGTGFILGSAAPLQWAHCIRCKGRGGFGEGTPTIVVNNRLHASDEAKRLQQKRENRNRKRNLRRKHEKVPEK